MGAPPLPLFDAGLHAFASNRSKELLLSRRLLGNGPHKPHGGGGGVGRGGGGGGGGGQQGQPPSCLYPQMWEKISAPGRKCCGNCRKCPKWGTGDTLRVIGANHKSGTFLSIGVMQSVRQVAVKESCLLAARTVVSVHWNGLDGCKACQPVEGRPTLVMAFVRDPFELIVSGYLYHHAGKEAWCTWPMRGGFRGDKTREYVDFGISTLVEAKKAPSVNSGESYQSYLQRLDPASGILAEFIRASHRDLPALEAGWVASQASSALHNASYACLDSFMAPKNSASGEDPYMETWERIFKFFRYPPESIAPSLRAAQKHDIVRNPQTLKGHGTQHSTMKRTKLFNTAVQVDRDIFGGKYADLSSRLNCPRPSGVAPPNSGGGS